MPSTMVHALSEDKSLSFARQTGTSGGANERKTEKLSLAQELNKRKAHDGLR